MQISAYAAYLRIPPKSKSLVSKHKKYPNKIQCLGIQDQGFWKHGNIHTRSCIFKNSAYYFGRALVPMDHLNISKNSAPGYFWRALVSKYR
jgi:hypothetical protein